MARLASIANAGFFATPPEMTDHIRTYLTAPHGGRALDPCAGEGIALGSLAASLHLEPYANELNQERAKHAAAHITQVCDTLHQLPRRELPHRDTTTPNRVIEGDFRVMNTAKDGYNLLYLNPPYDSGGEDGDKRLEFTFLKKASYWLQPGGVLVFLVPMTALLTKDMVSYLSSTYDRMLVTRFPQPDYDRFHQVVIFGVRRPKQIMPDMDFVTQLTQAAFDTISDLSAWPYGILMPQTQPIYELPRLRKPTGHLFRSLFIEPDAADEEAKSLGAATTAIYARHLHPQTDNMAGFRPLMPLKVGHLAGLLAAGFLDNQVIENDDQRLLIKGRAVKMLSSSEHEETGDEGDKKVTTTSTEYFVTEVTAVSPDGQIQEISGEDLPDFLQTWLPQLTSTVARTYEPVYQFDTGIYGQRIGKRGSLFPVQKHVAAATALRLSQHKDALIIGEMGTGKTRVAAAVIPAIRARRVLLACPPHLWQKWQRELQLVVPEARISHLQTISDVDTFMTREATPERPLIGLMKFTTARAASGWMPAVNYWELFSPAEVRKLTAYRQALAEDKEPPQIAPELLAKQKYFYTWLNLRQTRGVRCPTTGKTMVDKDGKPLPYSHFMSGSKQHSYLANGESVPEQAGAKHRFCALFQYKRGGSGNIGSFKRYAIYEKQERARLRHGATSIFSAAEKARFASRGTSTGGRVPLASYILRQYDKDTIDLAIFDEVHQLKAADSDQGYALGRLARASKKVLGLTGTIYGGKASTLFHLLYRTANDMRRDFTDTEGTGKSRIMASAWIARYGLMETVETKHLNANGKQSGNKKSTTQYKEAPGSSPKMLPYLLNRAAFMSQSDMGFALPDYEEIPVLIKPTAAMKQQLRWLDDGSPNALEGVGVGQRMRESLVKGDRSLLSTYLQASLCMPDAPWREEVIEDPQDKKLHPKNPIVLDKIPALPSSERTENGSLRHLLYPKEQAIVNLIRDEANHNRNTLLLCQQTRTRDITPRWVDILKDAGLKVAVMNVDAAHREEWINQQHKLGVQVIIAHPKAVETGLDILEYPTVIWMGTEYSVYTIQQASYRPRRIIQKKAVKVYFFAYEGTMQEIALSLIAKKLAAAVRVNGDVIATDSIANLGGNSIEDTLGRMIANNESLEVGDLASMFADANEGADKAPSFIGHDMPDEPEPEPEPEVTFTKAKIVPTRTGVIAIPIPDKDVVPETAPPAAAPGMRVVSWNQLVFGKTNPDKYRKTKPKRSTPTTQPLQMSLFG